jgi:hypothetical protein
LYVEVFLVKSFLGESKNYLLRSCKVTSIILQCYSVHSGWEVRPCQIVGQDIVLSQRPSQFIHMKPQRNVHTDTGLVSFPKAKDLRLLQREAGVQKARISAAVRKNHSRVHIRSQGCNQLAN